MTEKQRPISPQDLILNYFAYKQTDCLGLDELIGISIALGCPDANTAQGVLNNLVNSGSLEWFRDESNQVVFFLPSDQDKAQ